MFCNSTYFRLFILPGFNALACSKFKIISCVLNEALAYKFIGLFSYLYSQSSNCRSLKEMKKKYSNHFRRLISDFNDSPRPQKKDFLGAFAHPAARYFASQLPCLVKVLCLSNLFTIFAELRKLFETGPRLTLYWAPLCGKVCPQSADLHGFSHNNAGRRGISELLLSLA